MTHKAVLVADDDPDFRGLLRLVIEAWAFPVLEAADFAEVATLARTERGRIGLVLLDYFMPGDRDDATAALREVGGSIVLCTACDDAKRLACDLGLAAALPKPIDFDKLEGFVRTICEPDGA
jgi:DNA-binding response OmpR family regulator